MDNIPLLNPALVRAARLTSSNSGAGVVLRARIEAVEKVAAKEIDTPVKTNQTNNNSNTAQTTEVNPEKKHPPTTDSKTPRGDTDTLSQHTNKSNAPQPQKNERALDTKALERAHYKITLSIGPHNIETISDRPWPKGSEIRVQVLPGPELKILPGDPASNAVQADIKAQGTPQTLTPAERLQGLSRQLLADRVPITQGQSASQLIRQLSQLLPAELFNPTAAKEPGDSDNNRAPTSVRSPQPATTQESHRLIQGWLDTRPNLISQLLSSDSIKGQPNLSQGITKADGLAFKSWLQTGPRTHEAHIRTSAACD